MSTLELIDKKEQLRKKAEEMIANAEKEERKLNDGEADELGNGSCHGSAGHSEIDKQIRDINEELNKSNKKEKKMENFSLLKAINDVANNRQMDERSLEVVNAGIAEMRKAGLYYSGQIVLPIEERADIVATVATNG